MDPCKLALFAFVIAFATSGITFVGTEARTFTECNLARELVQNGVSIEHVGTWMCIIGDNRTTSKVVDLKPNNGYGLFTLNSRYWCREGPEDTSPNGCDMSCEKLTDDCLTDDVECIQIMYSNGGFGHWGTKGTTCEASHVDVSHCFRHTCLNSSY